MELTDHPGIRRPNLLAAIGEVLRDAKVEGNFMLRLRDRELSEGSVAAFVARLASASTRIALPGYRRDWYPAPLRPPAWGEALAAGVEEDGEGFHLPAGRATSPELAGFWRDATFQGPVRSTKGPYPRYRPALPVIELPPEALGTQEVADHVTPDIAFSGDLRRRRQRFFEASVRYVDARLSRGSESMFALYQDPAWLFVLGNHPGMEAVLLALHRRFAASEA